MTGNGAGHGGAARGYRWPDATPGNELATVTGYSSDRRITPLAETYERELLDHGPAHLRGDHAGTWLPLIRQYCRVLAQCELLAIWIGEQDLVAALTETSTEEETTDAAKGKIRRRTVSQRTVSAIAAYDRCLARLNTLSDRLLLSPAAMARARMDMAPKFDLAKLIMELPEDTDGR